MRFPASLFIALLLMLWASQGSSQTITVNEEDDSARAISLRTFYEDDTDVPGQGEEVDGIGLLGKRTRHLLGDVPYAAGRTLVDTTWLYYRTSLDTVLPSTGVHWLRVPLNPDSTLKGVPMVLRVASRVPVRIYLNGERVLQADEAAVRPGGIVDTRTADIPPLNIPLIFLCDGNREVITIRSEGTPGTSLTDHAIEASLHTADINYRTQRSMLHHGVFIGINILIALLALISAWSEKQRTGWVFLGVLSLLVVLDVVSSLGGAEAMLGMSDNVREGLRKLNMLLLPWTSYMLIRVICEMGVELTAKRKRLYLIAALVVTALVIAFLIGEAKGLVEANEGLGLLNDQPWIIIPGLFMIALFGIIVLWFSIDVIRLGIRLLRTPGFGRWIGAGAVASSLLTILLNIISAVSGDGLSAWFSLVADYSSYVAVPVSVAVFMAIRAAHHNRLVARQRDELDLEVQERTAELRKEKDRSDELLLNILPAEVAEELKAQGSAAARHFDLASVLFTDFKGFTTLAAQVEPAELLNELNICFKAFDDIIGAHGVEKIKTIGDAYMCAGGLPDPGTSSPLDVVNAALEMQTFMRRRKSERTAIGKPAFDMRLGIHTGPVVAGIVGVKKFQYDIWGDTVNTASRMESCGEIGQVNISRATYDLVKDQPGLEFTPRGFVEVKGKGELEMFFVRRSLGEG
ncbi:MAG: hypothetical protein JNJ91_11840 [Flavobacteriales bacterium]|nr:hypothetical protein [Flavobacteriales bacterium]